MKRDKTQDRYSVITQFFHWTIVIIFSMQFFTFYYKTYFQPESKQAAKLLIGQIHKPLGVIALVIGLFFIVWTFIEKKPPYTQTLRSYEKNLAKLVHSLLLLLILTMPLTGLLMSIYAGREINIFGFITVQALPQSIDTVAMTYRVAHQYISYLGIFLIVAHIGASFKHHFIDKDATLKRMVPFL